MISRSGFSDNVLNMIRDGATIRARLIRGKGLGEFGCSLTKSWPEAYPDDGNPIMCMSASGMAAREVPNFSNMRVSVTGFNTEASTIVLFFITCANVRVIQSVKLR
jgi:hypothetical protein